MNGLDRENRLLQLDLSGTTVDEQFDAVHEAAGLLDKRRSTTHWRFAKELQRRFPETRVEIDRIFIADGPIWTSARLILHESQILAETRNHGNRPGCTASETLVEARSSPVSSTMLSWQMRLSASALFQRIG